MVSRLTLLSIAFVAGYFALIFNLYNVQLNKGQYYLVRAESQYAASSLLNAERGVIYFTDKNGNLLPGVTNKDFPQIYAVPKAIDDPEEVSHQLAPILNEPQPDILKKLSKTDDKYELLLKKAGLEVASKIESAELKGVYVESVPERFYPFGRLAAQVLGFVAPNSKDAGESGRYGVEEYYNDNLSGVPGEVKENKLVLPQAGNPLRLTIDPTIQTEGERILTNLVTTYKAKSGSVIVEDPRTGKILAMGSFPSFDPNNYSESPLANFLNPATQQIYEPGSVFKVLTMAAGIDAGKITPHTQYTDTGELVLNGRTVRNWDLKAHGRVDMTYVIEHSLNTGAAFAARTMGLDVFRKYMQAFGLGDKTGVDLRGELAGDLRRLNPGAKGIALATASFGQGVAVTPLGMLNAVAAIANGGKLMRPYVNAEAPPEVIREVISPETAKEVTQMMVSAVDGAEVARISGYAVAGKTGTAQVPDLKNGGYLDGAVNNTYIGFAPATSPRFIILIKINEPEGAPLAGLTVVPAFRDLAQFILNYYNVPPDRINS